MSAMKRLIGLFSLLTLSICLFSQDAFITTWQTDIPGASLENQIKIPGIGNYDIYWEEVGNASNNGTASASGSHTLTFLTAGTYQIHLSGGLQQIQFEVYPNDSKKLVELNQWGDIAWTSMNKAFNHCRNMEYYATDVPDLSNVVDCSQMFESCQKMDGDLSNWDVSNVQNMYSMFSNCYIFNGDISNWDMSSVINTSRMFNVALEFNQDISNWEVSNVTDMSGMFEWATKFDQNLGAWDIDQVTDLGFVFNKMNSLSVNNYDAILIAWLAQSPHPNQDFRPSGLKYCNGQAARQNLINDYNWSFQGDALDCTSLPVELSLFKATTTENDVLLHWTTESELNNAFFEVQRSIDGVVWSSLTSIEGHGTTLSAQHYSYVDAPPVYGNLYYRLRQVDTDGSFTYSEVLNVYREGVIELSVFPNPANQYINLFYQGKQEQTKTFTIYNAQGKPWQKINYPTNTPNAIRLDISNYPPGVYFIKADQHTIHHFVKSR